MIHKKLCHFFALFVLCLGLEATVQAEEAPAAPTAEMVARWVQGFYDQTKDVASQFVQVYYSQLYQKSNTSKGKVVFKKPGKMRWDYAAPNGKVIVSNGNSVLMYEPGEDGEVGQVFEQAMGDAQLPQALSFLTGTAKLSDNFSFRLLDATQHAYKSGYVLELRPLSPSPHYERILFFVDADPARRGIVHRVLIIDPAGNRNRFDFGALQFNKNATETLFRWKPPADARRIKP